MLKRLAILGLLVVGLVYGAWSQVPGDRSRQDQKPQGGQNGANPPQSLPTRVNAEVAASEEKKSPDPQPSKYPWHELYGPANIPNWFLVLLGAGAVYAAVKTLRIISLQTNLMREQLGRMVEKERARLKVQCEGVEVQGSPPETWILVADIEIANHGASNAYITRKRGKLSVAPIRGNTPELDDSCDILLPYPFDIIKPGVEPIHVAVYLEDAPSSFRDLCIGITSSRLTMHLYGFIDYETMGECWRLPFRYKWVMPTIQDNISEGDLAKDINIVGGWDKPCEQGNGEYRIKPN
jgi:hypothetical protein